MSEPSENLGCECGVGPGKAMARRKCGARTEWVHKRSGMRYCDQHARYFRGPRKGQIMEDVVRWEPPHAG